MKSLDAPAPASAPDPSAHEGEGATAVLAGWTARLRFEHIPAGVLAHIKLCILDGLGCGLFGSRQPWGRIATEVAAELAGDGPSSLWGTKRRTGPAEAALANGTAGHGFEIDDIHVTSLIHPGAVTIPAALAVAEARGVSGKALITAIVAGYEVGLRVGICAGVSHGVSGFHPTGTVGCLAAAAGVANLLGLDGEAATDALGIGATQAAGLYSARTGAMAKRFHAGRAAQSGVIAAMLAEKGFTGSREVLETPFGGFISTMSQNTDLTPLTDGLGERWETLKVGFKAYAACASAHTTIDALDRLMARGLTADNLDRLRIFMSRVGSKNIGWEYRPAGVIAAQMNGFYTAAVKLLDGDAFIDQYKDERLEDPAILALIDRIEILHDPALDAGGAAKRHAVRVEARLADGAVLEEYVEQRRGSPDHPLTAAELEDKFRRTAGAVLNATAVEELMRLVASLEESERLDRLGDLLTLAG